MAAGAEAKKMVPEFEKQYIEVCNLGSAHLKQGWQSLQEYHADNYFIARFNLGLQTWLLVLDTSLIILAISQYM